MTKQIYIIIGLLLAFVLIGIIIWIATIPSEPVYEGRAVSGWLHGHVASSAAFPPYGSPGWKQADAALRKLGTNAIPTLLKMIAAKDLPEPVINLWNWATKHHLPLRSYHYAYSSNEEARYAFEVLGQSCTSAVPALTKIYQQNLSPESKRCAASALGSIGHAAQSALPVLLADFKDTNKQVRFDAVSAVMNIGGDTNVVLPALMSAARDVDVDVRWNAIVGLSYYENRARVAVPVLLDELQDCAKVGSTPIKEAVETALWRIAPEQVGFPLVIAENASLTNGAFTINALDFQYNDQRKKVVPAGKPIPCVRQFWSHQPRGSFTVIQSSGSARPEEANLGEFEVLDIAPPPTEVNVSVLCVIADGKTFLCARDNNRNQFLKIRKAP